MHKRSIFWIGTLTTIINEIALIFLLATINSSCKDEDDPPLMPVISGFSPASGFPGDIVTITGKNFDANIAGNEVDIGGEVASVISASTTSIDIVVPELAASGKVTVKARGQSTSSANNFTVNRTSIASFSPVEGIIGTE